MVVADSSHHLNRRACLYWHALIRSILGIEETWGIGPQSGQLAGPLERSLGSFGSACPCRAKNNWKMPPVRRPQEVYQVFIESLRASPMSLRNFPDLSEDLAFQAFRTSVWGAGLFQNGSLFFRDADWDIARERTWIPRLEWSLLRVGGDVGSYHLSHKCCSKAAHVWEIGLGRLHLKSVLDVCQKDMIPYMF